MNQRFPRALPWFLWLDPTPRPGWRNMALDMSLHARAAQSGHAYLRLYRWDPSCLSFGRHEPALRRYDRAHIEALGLDTVRRPTGGRAVWHAGELTYAVAAPEWAMGTLRETYRFIHDAIASALRNLGAPVTLAPDRRAVPLDRGACFAEAAGGEVVLDAGKVVGSAQLRSNGALLQHGSVLIEDDQTRIGEISLHPAVRPDIRPLARILGRTVSWEEVANAIDDAARPWGDEWSAFEREEERARLVVESDAWVSRFRDPEWTWQR